MYISVGPREIKALSVEAKQLLLSILNQIVRTLVLPAQEFCVLLTFLWKSGGGERPIALLGLIYRILMSLMRLDVLEFDVPRAGHWDSALKKHSAIRYALLRSLRCEAGNLNGLDSVQVLFDNVAFFR